MFRLFRSKIFSRQFFAFLLLICFTLFTISFVLLTVSQESLREQHLLIAESYRMEVSETIQRWIKGRTYSIRIQANYLGNLAPDRLGNPEITKILIDQLSWNENFYDIVILDEAGNIINSKDGAVKPINVIDRKYFIDAMQGKSSITGFIQSRKDNYPVMVIAEPIYINGEVKFVLIGLISLERIKEIIEALKLGNMGHAYLVDNEGTFVTDSRFISDFINDRKSLNKEKYKINTIAVERVKNGEEGTDQYLDFEGKEVFGSYEWLESIQAGLIVEFIDKEMMKPIDVLKRVIFFLGIGVLFIGMLLAFFLTKKILGPLNMLISASENIIRQDYQNPILHRTNNELDTMIDTFNNMQAAIVIREEQLKAKNEELKVQRAEAIEANKLKSQFLANMSHELRTPLNSIIGFTNRVIKKTVEILPEVQMENLKIVKEEAQHLLDLINDLLDYSKIEAGKMEVNVDEFQLEKVLDEVHIMTKTLIGSRSIHYQQQLYTLEPIYMIGDRIKVKQILINLLSNAFKYSDQGTVKVTIKKDLSMYSITVQDEGVGIQQEDLQYIFDEFRQVDGSYTRKIGGTGLGLSITKRFVEMLGGCIEVESTFGQGTRFTVHLPIIYDKKQMNNSDRLVSKTNTLGKKVVCIDDDPNVQRLYKQYLGEHGFEIFSFGGEEDISKEIIKIQPDVILLDIMLPKKDGWEILAELKDHPKTRKIPVIMASVLSEKNLAYKMRADEYLIKPVEQQELLDAIQQTSIRKQDIEVLLVDDDENYLNLMGQFLKEEGIGYRLAQDGEEALHILHQWQPDLLVLDIMMPKKDGFEVINEIEKNKALEDLPIIIVTAKDLDKNERMMLRKRSNMLIQKSGNHIEDVLAFLIDKVREKVEHEKNTHR